jgi:hypothetical protein
MATKEIDFQILNLKIIVENLEKIHQTSKKTTKLKNENP